MAHDRDIDGIDREIIRLLSERTERYVKNLKDNPPGGDIFSADERSRVVGLIAEVNGGPLPNRVLEKIYTDILTESMSLAVPFVVSFMGPEGSFSGVAVREFFGGSIRPVPQKTIQDVFQQVEAGNARYGVVPIENSTEGSVTFTLDELADTRLSILSERYIRVTYSLLSKGSDIDAVGKIYAHPQTIGQCKGWIRSHLPGAEVVSVESTSRAAELAASEDGTAAIASDLAGGIYRLKTLATMIEDLRNNYTRFFLVGNTVNRPTGNDKTSIMCTVKDKPGALLDILKPFSEEGINMTRIESRPDKKKMWEYNFFIDILGHMSDAAVTTALEKIKNEALFLKILGSYPVGN